MYERSLLPLRHNNRFRITQNRLQTVDGGQILYFDTDSCLWVRKRGGAEPPLPFGNCLGEVTDEIANEFGPERYIKKFASIGPKAYCFVLDDGREVFKAKGVPALCRPNDGFRIFKDMVANDRQRPYSYAIPFHITRNKCKKNSIVDDVSG